MHKKYVVMIMSALCIFSFAACGSTNASNEVEVADEADIPADSNMYLLDFDPDEYINLGNYKNLEVDYIVPSVDDEELEEEAQNIIYEYVEYSDKSTGAEVGDQLTIDFNGLIDGEAFDGGSDTDYAFILGEGEFLEDFESSIYGAAKGDTVVAKFKFPDDYGDLGGKEVEFTIDIKNVQSVIYPEYNDAFVAENTEYENVEEYEKSIYDELLSDATDSSYEEACNEAISKAIEGSTYEAVPDELLDYCYESTLSTYESYAEMFGMDMDDFIANFVGDSEDAIKDEANSWAKEIILLKAIGKKEKMDFDDLYSTEAEALASEYQYESLAQFESDYGKFDVYVNVMREKVIEKIMETTKLSEVSSEEYYNE